MKIGLILANVFDWDLIKFMWGRCNRIPWSGGLNFRKLFLTVGRLEVQVKVLGGLVSSEAALLGVLRAVFYPSSHMVFPLCVLCPSLLFL